MKKYSITAMMLSILIILGACNESSATETQNPLTEELKIQIDVATDEFLGTFTHLHQATVGTDGATLVIWANQPLPNFNVTLLIPDWSDDRDDWMFNTADSFGSAEVLLPDEAFVIKNYMGSGTLPSRGITFRDENGGNTRVFFFQENHAYPEHGGRWTIQEIAADRLTWKSICWFYPPSEGDYTITINGAEFAFMYGNADHVYTLAGEQYPTHVHMAVLFSLGLDTIQGGSQIALQHNNEGIGVALSVINYLASGTDRVVVGIDDIFMADNGYFTQYIPISLLRHLGFDVYFEGGRVHIDGQLNVAVNPHPLAVALQNFINNAEGETRAFVTHVGGVPGVAAIEFIDGFAEATLFVNTGLEVIYREIGSIEGFPFSIGNSTDGSESFIKMTGDGGRRSYTVFATATNPVTIAEEIIEHLTIYAELQDDQSMNYYRFNGGWLEGIEGARHSITEEEFNEIRSMMGISDWVRSWRDLSDSTESILSWVSSAFAIGLY